MTVPRVKICGIRNPTDGVAAVDAGADYIGVVFAGTVRRVGVEAAAQIVAAVGARSIGVGVFVDEPEGQVAAIHGVVGFGVAQLHGSETPEVCDDLRTRGLDVWKAIRPKTSEELSAALTAYAPVVDAVLIEGFSPAAAGGTGTTFPYGWFAEIDRPPGLNLVLAGGLTVDNVGLAIEEVSPRVVDVSSGVESAPGVKSISKIQAFMDAVRETGVQSRKVARG